ncbi:MAG: hypothetical protein M3R50_12495 [Bacteroidota bacterium]|nr:hypothetical protein [Bacteroidota bacterium]
MKKLVVIAAFMMGLSSCGSNGNSNMKNGDSTKTELPSNDNKVTQGSIQLPPETNGATGTTGTGTVSDSGNAAHPGSDTSYHTPKK